MKPSGIRKPAETRAAPRRQRPAVRIAIISAIVLAVIVFLALMFGQGIKLPSFSPSSAASEAMAEYDTNKDGFLDSVELERCPALKGALKRFDTDGDGRLSENEIRDRLASYKEKPVGRMTVTCQVLRDNVPLAGAKVTFVPEKCMGSSYKPGTGTTDANGFANLQIEGEELPGLPSGLYRVEISKPNAQGQESLAAWYNTQTTLGQEVAPDAVSGRAGGITFRLTSR